MSKDCNVCRHLNTIFDVVTIPPEECSMADAMTTEDMEEAREGDCPYFDRRVE